MCFGKREEICLALSQAHCRGLTSGPLLVWRLEWHQIRNGVVVTAEFSDEQSRRIDGKGRIDNTRRTT